MIAGVDILIAILTVGAMVFSLILLKKTHDLKRGIRAAEEKLKGKRADYLIKESFACKQPSQESLRLDSDDESDVLAACQTLSLFGNKSHLHFIDRLRQSEKWQKNGDVNFNAGIAFERMKRKPAGTCLD